MEPVSFLHVESGDDLIISFAIDDDERDVKSLTLLRTPKYESFLNDSERGVNVSHEVLDEEGSLLVAVDIHGDEARIVSESREYSLDIHRVDEDEIEEAKKVLVAMNFDSRFRLDVG